MKKAILSILLCASTLAAALVGCAGSGKQTADTTNSSNTSQASTQTSSEPATSEPTTLNLWTFVDLHSKFYKSMAETWNKENPKEQIDLKTTILPYADMHNKLTIALQSGTGAPDICDVEVSKFSNYLKGTPSLVELNKYIEKYGSSVISTRLNIYSKDGKNYGVPTHVGATVMFYDTELLDKANIDYKDIVTWDDYREAGKKLKDATGKSMGFAETKGAYGLSAILAEEGGDLTTSDGKPDLNSDAVVKSATLLQDMLNDGTLEVCTGGYPDTEECYGYINKGNIGSILMPFWFMSRFTDYMPDQSGKWAVSVYPLLTKDQKPTSVGLGGTGTVVTNQSKSQELAAKFITWAKLSPEGEQQIWEQLGFDPVNKAIWTDDSITKNSDNKFIKYFTTNPFDTLNKVSDNIKEIKNCEVSPLINDTLTTTTLNSIFNDKKDVKSALDEAQKTVENQMQ